MSTSKTITPRALLPDLSLAVAVVAPPSPVTVHGEGNSCPASKPLTGQRGDMGVARRVPQEPPSSVVPVGVEAQDPNARSLVLLRSH
ncbi:hypothetical protein E2562_020446 [Oryza meyeriana var. granulata]|uniref:Uncharacterized protein n=1 Tax=Oryza meyeriana var. granulata TaxID=110450 RepID=A0A6G1D686_9ORYZ|nr:hypothetical protein E2562_020446 [Oryza meyeriana var. granulata]